MKKLFILTFCVAALGISSTAKAKSRPGPTLITNWFQVSGGAMFDSSGGFSGASGVSWIPTYWLNPQWRLQLSLGAMLGNLGAASSFFMGDSALTVVYTEAQPLTLEAGGGVQYWDGRRNFHPMVRGGIGFRFRGKGLLIHALKVYYSNVFTPFENTHQVFGAISVRF